MDINQMLYPTSIYPEAVGPNTVKQAQITNCLSQQKSRTWVENSHVRIKSNETVLSVGRRHITEWSQNNQTEHLANNEFSEDMNDRIDTKKNLFEEKLWEFEPKRLPLNFVDWIAHTTKSNVFLSDKRGEIIYEKQRFYDLKKRESLTNQMMNSEKEIQEMNKHILDLNSEVDKLLQAMDLKNKRRDCVIFVVFFKKE